MDVLASVACAGSAAIITVTGIHPIDVVKTRLQVSGAEGARNYKQLGIVRTISIIAKEEGITAFWKGIQAAWLREASYTSLRLGLYGPIKKAMGLTNDSHFFSQIHCWFVVWCPWFYCWKSIRCIKDSDDGI